MRWRSSRRVVLAGPAGSKGFAMGLDVLEVLEALVLGPTGFGLSHVETIAAVTKTLHTPIDSRAGFINPVHGYGGFLRCCTRGLIHTGFFPSALHLWFCRSRRGWMA